MSGALPIGATGTITPASRGTVTIPNSPAMVSFPPGAINASGPVTVTLTDINSGSSPRNMPGDFTTMISGTERLIESFGAISVNLSDSAGQPLNLGTGQTATIRIPVSTRSSTTPARTAERSGAFSASAQLVRATAYALWTDPGQDGVLERGTVSGIQPLLRIQR